MKITFVATAAVIALVAGPVEAQTPAAEAARALFQHADLDGNGRLSRVEFDAAREGLFARADANHDARLTFSELRAFRPQGASRPTRRPSRDQIQELREIDRNNDRAIDIGEFRAAGAQRFVTADVNRDGYISREEIVGLVQAFGLGA